jgi:hypothetical protein
MLGSHAGQQSQASQETQADPTKDFKMKHLIILLAACGGGATGNPTTDAQPEPDDGSVVLIDAPPSQTGLVEVMLDCQPYTREVRHAATDNSRDVTINRYAITTLAPGDRFVLSRCDAPKPLPCFSGDVCTGAHEPSFDQSCIVTSGGAGDGDRFLDGKLVVWCGTRTERYLSSGTLTTTTQTTFTVKLEIFQ